MSALLHGHLQRKSAHSNLPSNFECAVRHHQSGRLAQAKDLYLQTLQEDPAHFDALHLLGVIAFQSGDAALSVDLITQALNYNATHPTAYLNLGNAQRSLKQLTAANKSYDRAIELSPHTANAHYNKGLVLMERQEFDLALTSLQQAIKIQPESSQFIHQCGLAYQALAQYSQAIQCFDHALQLQPDLAEALNDKGFALLQLRQSPAAMVCYQQAVSLNPKLAASWHNLGLLQLAAKDLESAHLCLETAYALQPDLPYLLGVLLHTQMHIAQWGQLDERLTELWSQLSQGHKVLPPFVSVTLNADLKSQTQAAHIWVNDKLAAYNNTPPLAPYKGHSKIRIGYFSADLQEHATAYLMAELFELHDKNQFEIYAYSFGPAHTDPMRQRLIKAFDHFHDVGRLTDEQIVTLARSHEIDIAIDLKGYTTDSRADIFAIRLAPLQVNYLGYPGTMGAPFMDYLIADTVIIPQEHIHHYAEKIAYMPGCYQANDRHRKIAALTLSRSEAGLPDNGFVYCCFNNTYKITPQVLDSWARILQQVEGSVLWLLADNAPGVINLIEQAKLRGIAPERLVFAPRIPLDRHLARHRLADVFLDTLPCNAHTTASDALWTGLPVLTCMGEAFASRVAASLLQAVGMPEIICESVQDLESLAISLARNPALLADLKIKLRQQLSGSALFNTPQYTQHLESAYTHMYAQNQAGQAPEHFGVQWGEQSADALYEQARIHHNQGALELALRGYANALKLQPDHFNTLHMAGILMAQQSEFESAVTLLEQAVKVNPDHADAHSNLGMVLNELKQFEQSKPVLQRAIQLNPESPIAFSNLGLACGELEEWAQAAQYHAQAIVLAPANAASHYNQGHTLIQAREFEAALASFEQALVLNPHLVQAWTDKGLALDALKRPHQALQAFEAACHIQPDYGRAHFCLGKHWADQKQFDNALEAFNRVVECNPNDAQAFCSKGTVYSQLKQYKVALQSLDQALAINPDLEDAHINKALVLQLMGKMPESLVYYNRAINATPNNAILLNNRAAVLQALNRHQEALNDLEKALELNPSYVDALVNQGNVYIDIKRIDEAVKSYSRALEIEPEREFLEGMRLHAQMHICDWTDYENRRDQIIRKIKEGKKVAPPFGVLAITDDIAVQRMAAQLYLPPEVPPSEEFPKLERYANHSRIRLGYFSADFHDHATMYLMAEFFELHDKSKFEIHAFSFGPDKNDEMRQRAVKAFEHFHDVRNYTDEEIVHLSRSLEIDIAFDLKGCTQGCRPRIFALRAAPIQINYLGYPGSMGVSYMDYIIADRIVIPEHLKDQYSEKVLYLDGCYQPQDTLRKINDVVMSRNQFGLPENCFIYCCFNNNYKITPDILNIWANILNTNQNSSLWLLEDNIIASQNLLLELAKRDISERRVFFAKRTEISLHLARQRLADLFIDTFPCSAHTTATDALSVGLKLISLSGDAFASRVSLSIGKLQSTLLIETDNKNNYQLHALNFTESAKNTSTGKYSTQSYTVGFEEKIFTILNLSQ